MKEAIVGSALTLGVTLTLGFAITNVASTSDFSLSELTGQGTLTETTSETVMNDSCALNDDAVTITLSDGSGEDTVDLTGTASLSNCETTVNGDVTADFGASSEA